LSQKRQFFRRNIWRKLKKIYNIGPWSVFWIWIWGAGAAEDVLERRDFAEDFSRVRIMEAKKI
jgi:hypothetical protein